MAFLPTNTHSKPTGKLESCAPFFIIILARTLESWDLGCLTKPLFPVTKSPHPIFSSYQAWAPPSPMVEGWMSISQEQWTASGRGKSTRGPRALEWIGSQPTEGERGMVSLRCPLCHCHPVPTPLLPLCSLPANTSSSTEPRVQAGWGPLCGVGTSDTPSQRS